jgi:DNA-binding NarL/FixJ family response regulator
MDNKIRVGVVDEQPLFRDGVVYNLQAHSDIEVVGQGSSANDAIRIVNESVPDVIILDLSVQGGGINAVERIAMLYPMVKILVLTAATDEEQVCMALKRGARGYLLKGASASELLKTVRLLFQGECYVSPNLAAKLLTSFGQGQAATAKQRDRFSELSNREEQILSRLVQGLSNKEIGNKLDLSEKTIKHYVTNILQKLQVRNRVEAAILASDRMSELASVRKPERVSASQ